MTRIKEMETKLEDLCKDLKSLIDKGGFVLSDVEKMQDRLRVFDENWQDVIMFDIGVY
jgi:hypothetical protein